MKTVMKKMFSLLLVAVMLIGVMPFAAFATEVDVEPQPTTYTITFYNADGSAPMTAKTTNAEGKLTTEAIGEVNNVATSNGLAGWTSTKGSYETVDLNTYTATSNASLYAVPTTTTCDQCDTTYPVGEKHEHCSVCSGLNGTHNAGCIQFCNNSTTCPNPVGGNHNAGCPGNIQCSNCGDRGHLVENCPKIVCSDCGYALATGDHKAGCITKCNNQRDCPNETVENGHHNPDCKYALCNIDQCTKEDGHSGEHTGAPCTDENCDYFLGHSGKHSYLCPVSGCELPVNHEGKHSNEYTHPNGSSKVKIYANLYTGDVLTKTVPLVVYNEDPNTSIADSIAEHKDLIYAELEDQYSGYEWSGNVYDSENEDGENMNSKVGKGINVHINAHSKENIVYLYVHNARTYDRIGIVRLHGKKVGEAVKESEVRKAVKEYFSFSSLKMYDTEKWDLYVDGKDVKSDDTLTVGSNHYVIDVKISGSAKNTSGAKADSSNPKTGDAIFAPAAVLGLSATTLAVLFYLNKKRAY